MVPQKFRKQQFKEGIFIELNIMTLIKKKTDIEIESND
jgi:hypothetical protein